MKNQSSYVKGIRKLFNQLKRAGTIPEFPEASAPMEHLILGVLSEGTHIHKAQAAMKRLFSHAVDHNDLRVSTADELARVIQKHLPGAKIKTQTLTTVLNAVYQQENTISLMSLKTQNRTKIRRYLESLEGITPYTIAWTMLGGFGLHAVPVDEPMLKMLKQKELIDPNADLPSAQSFLERHIRFKEAKSFILCMKQCALSSSTKNRTQSRKSTKKPRAAKRT